MHRPNGLALTAFLMAVLITTGLVLTVAHTKLHLRAGVLILFGAIFAVGYSVVWFYWQGRNWARIAVLVWSALSVLDLISLAGSQAQNRLLIAIWGLLGMFLLYWLNTRPIRQFFTQPKK